MREGKIWGLDYFFNRMPGGKRGDPKREERDLGGEETRGGKDRG